MKQISIGDAVYLSEPDVEAGEIHRLPKNKFIRVEIAPHCVKAADVLEDAGCFPCDMTLKVEIRLTELNQGIGHLCRFKVEREEYSPELLSIAQAVFVKDRRFFLSRKLNVAASKDLIEAFVMESLQHGDEWLVCRHQEKACGFIALRRCGEGKRFIHLGAVLPEYQRVGVALSLYYKACLYCLEHGDNAVQGRISAANIAVMNLYTKLGAVFSEPLAVYARERNVQNGAE